MSGSKGLGPAAPRLSNCLETPLETQSPRAIRATPTARSDQHGHAGCPSSNKPNPKAFGSLLFPRMLRLGFPWILPLDSWALGCGILGNWEFLVPSPFGVLLWVRASLRPLRSSASSPVL